MSSHGSTAYPYEACGFLLGSKGYNKTIFASKQAVNMSNEQNRYSINPVEFYQLEHSLRKPDLEVLGFFHSHTDGSCRPSKLDIALAWENYSYVIIGIEEGQIQHIKSWLINSQTTECLEEQLTIF